MDDEKKQNLKESYAVLCRYNLWRSGDCDTHPDPQKITKAIWTAAGAIIDYRISEKERVFLAKCLSIAEKELEIKENREEETCNIIRGKNSEIEKLDGEIKRLRGLLAANGIKYKKK